MGSSRRGVWFSKVMGSGSRESSSGRNKEEEGGGGGEGRLLDFV